MTDIPAERVLRRLQGHAMLHSKDWSETMPPRMIFIYHEGVKLRISDRIPLPLGGDMNPLSKIVAMSHLSTDPTFVHKHGLMRLIPPEWYAFGIFFEGWGVKYSIDDKAAVERAEKAMRERAIRHLPDRTSMRNLIVADREGRSYGVITHDNGTEPYVGWGETGSFEMPGVALESVDRITAAFIGFRDDALKERRQGAWN